jgi:hypothetical protein
MIITRSIQTSGKWMWSLALTGLLTSCDNQRAVPVSMSVTDSASVQIARISADPETLDEWTLAATPRVVLTGSETGDSTAFSPVGEVRWIASGEIVISDIGTKRLLVYDSTGNFQRSLGRTGDGPGEFRRIGALSAVGGDTVAAFDGTHRRLSYWHIKTGYISSVSVSEGASLDAWPANAWAWGDSMVVVLQLATTSQESISTGTKYRKWPMRAHLTLRDRAGQVVASSPAFDGMYTGLYDKGDMRVAFSNNPFAAIGRNRVYFGSGQDFSLSSLSARFDSAREVRWSALREPMSPAEVSALRAERAAQVGTQLPPERLQRMLDMEFTPELMPPSRPAIGRVLVDADERVWVERFEPARLGTATQKPGRVWHVLASDGQPIARFTLPERTRLEAVHGRHALVMQRDSVDVETVALYAVVPP